MTPLELIQSVRITLHMFVKVLFFRKTSSKKNAVVESKPAYSFPSRVHTGRQKKGRREGGAWLLALSRIQTSSFPPQNPNIAVLAEQPSG